MTPELRPIADPFVAAAPAGVRVRTRLRVSPQDEAVLWATGRHLGSLAAGTWLRGAPRGGWTRWGGQPPGRAGRGS